MNPTAPPTVASSTDERTSVVFGLGMDRLHTRLERCLPRPRERVAKPLLRDRRQIDSVLLIEGLELDHGDVARQGAEVRRDGEKVIDRDDTGARLAHLLLQ